jgi:hypothetical protein
MSNPKTKRALGYYLSGRFIGTSSWRRKKGVTFQNDPRNDRAAQRLLELESQIEIPEDMWLKLKPFYTENDDLFQVAVTIATRNIGFRTHPADFAAWLECLLEVLTTTTAVV